MDHGAVVAGVVLAVVVGGLAGYVISKGTNALPRIAHRTVVVHTDEESYRGVLIGQYRDVFVLAHASLVGSLADETLPGHVYIPRGKVLLIQAPA